MAATPFVLCEPTMARLAIRTFRSGPPRSGSCGQAVPVAGEAHAHGIEQPAIDLVDDLQVSGNEQLEPPEGHFSRASGSRVWFV